MQRDKLKGSTTGLPALAIFRGLYNRVAGKLGVDPSYVSRVARGERKSAAILAALEEEMAVIRDYLNNHLDGKSRVNGNSDHNGAGNHNGKLNHDGANHSDAGGKRSAAKESDAAPPAY
jgi:transcriptional regulator with XRE-family HTH domain